LAAAIPHVEGDDLTSQSIHSNPHPVPVCFPAYKAPELVHLSFQPTQDHSLSASCWLDIQVIRSCGKAFHHEIQEPAEPHGSVATLHFRDVPLCYSCNQEVEEGWHDRLQGEPI